MIEDPAVLQEIITKTLALKPEDLQELRVEAEKVLNSVPEGHWLRGLTGVSLRSLDALIAYRAELGEIGDDLLGSIPGLQGDFGA